MLKQNIRIQGYDNGFSVFGKVVFKCPCSKRAPITSYMIPECAGSGKIFHSNHNRIAYLNGLLWPIKVH